MLRKSNIIEIRIGEHSDSFGLMGAVAWRRYGPFLMNNVDLVEAVPAHVPYGSYIAPEAEKSSYDTVRDFHLNSFADPAREFVDESIPFVCVKTDERAETEPEILYTGADLFDLSAVQDCEGPHTDYLVTTWVCPSEREIELAVGHTAPFKLWINGELIGESDKCTWWTCENRHFDVKLRRGDNTVILKCSQQSESARYSLIPRRKDLLWLQHTDIDSRLV